MAPAGPRFAGSFPPIEDPEPALRVVTFNIQYARRIDEWWRREGRDLWLAGRAEAPAGVAA